MYSLCGIVCSIDKAVGDGPFGLFFFVILSDCLSCPRAPEPEPPRKVRVWTSDNLHLLYRNHIVWPDLAFEQCSTAKFHWLSLGPNGRLSHVSHVRVMTIVVCQLASLAKLAKVFVEFQPRSQGPLTKDHKGQKYWFEKVTCQREHWSRNLLSERENAASFLEPLHSNR